MSLGRLIALTAIAFLILFVVRRILLLVRGGLSVDHMNELKAKGALVVDVRTSAEFRGGAAPNSLNIPLDQLAERIAELPQDKPLIVCCASGARSAYAKQFLEKSGFSEVHNAGPWQACR